MSDSARSCAFCEYFDGGGLAKVQHARDDGGPIAGDCLNTSSPRFTTRSDETCPQFTPDDPATEE